MNIDTKAAASDIKRLLVKLREHDILLDPSTLPEALFLQVIEDNEVKGIPELEEKPDIINLTIIRTEYHPNEKT